MGCMDSGGIGVGATGCGGGLGVDVIGHGVGDIGQVVCVCGAAGCGVDLYAAVSTPMPVPNITVSI